jgi:alkylation response protein AidB-like acyl-CoA dehydrogenase
MVDKELESTRREVAALARRVGVEVLAPAGRTADQEGRVPDHVWKTLLETGLTVPVPEELGGAGVEDTVTLMLALENLAFGDPGITLAAFTSGAAALLIARHAASEEGDIVQRLTSISDARATVALYESGGRGGTEFATSVAALSNGRVRIRGTKVGVPLAGQADPIVVIGADAATGQVRAAIVPAGTAGVVVHPYPGALGLAATASGTVTFNATVPSANLLGCSDDAETLLNTVGQIRLAVAAIALGAAQRAIEYAAAYATERVAFGQAIAAFQGVSFPLAEAQIRIEAARLEVATLAAGLDAPDFTLATDLAAAVGSAITYATGVAAEATRTAVQTLGGHGFITEHPVELWYRAASTLSTLDCDLVRSPFQPAL